MRAKSYGTPRNTVRGAEEHLYHLVMDGIKQPAWKGGDLEGVPMFEAYTLEHMLQQTWDFDAFTTGYVVRDPEGNFLQQMPRLTTASPSYLREEGGDAFMAAVFIDLDRQPHEPWPTDPEGLEALKGHIDTLASLIPEAAIHATKRGIRVILRLRELVPLERYSIIANCAVQEVMAAATRGGVPVKADPACERWTQLARLPYVVRDGQRTDDVTFLHIPDPWYSWYPGASRVHEVSQEIEKKVNVIYSPKARPLTKPRMSDAGASLLALACSVAQPRLRTLAGYLKTGERFYDPGDRNSKTYAAVSSYVSFAYSRGMDPTPEDVLAAFWDSVSASKGTPASQALDETWEMILRNVARRAAAKEVFAEELARAIEAATDTTPKIVYMNSGRWIWDGSRRTYGPAISNKDTFMAEITKLHPDAAFSEDGKKKTIDAILRSHGTQVDMVRYILGQRSSRLLVEDGKRVLEIGVGPIARIQGVYHADCQEYLDKIKEGAGAGEGERLIHWICTSTRLEHPTTALMLRGASGSGKNMLIEALARIFTTKADFSQAMGRFNSVLLRTALIHLGEGLDSTSGSQVANRFRETVGGGTMGIEQKGIDSVEVRGNYRIVIASNNPRPLPVENTHSLDDFRAIATRVLHVWMDHSVSEYLEKLGGKAYTHDWVDRSLGDRVEPGKLVEHLVWMIENVDVPNYNSRWLVPAEVGQWHVKALLQGILRDVMETVVRRASDNSYPDIKIYDRKLWVAASPRLQQDVNKLQAKTWEVAQIQEAVESLQAGKPARLKVSAERERVFYPMPTDIVLAIAKPEHPEVFIEEQKAYARLRSLLS